MPDEKTDRKGVLGQIRNPLVFFALALLLIEAIIGAVVAASKMTGDQQFYSVIIMAFLFFSVLGAVAIITIKWPTHLYEEITLIKQKIDIQTETTRNFEQLINSNVLRDIVEEIVQNKIIQRKEASYKINVGVHQVCQ